MQLSNRNIRLYTHFLKILMVFLVILTIVFLFHTARYQQLRELAHTNNRLFMELISNSNQLIPLGRQYVDGHQDFPAKVLPNMQRNFQILEEIENVIATYYGTTPSESSATLLSTIEEIRSQWIVHNKQYLFYLSEYKHSIGRKPSTILEAGYFKHRYRLTILMLTAFQDMHHRIEHKKFATIQVQKDLGRLLFVLFCLFLFCVYGFLISVQKHILTPLHLAASLLATKGKKEATKFQSLPTKSPDCAALFSTMDNYHTQNKQMLSNLEHQLTLIQQLKVEAEGQAQRKEAFLSSMSHEIRTPLNAIIGGLDLLKQDSTLTKTTQQDLEDIRTASQLLMSVVNDILDFSKLEFHDPPPTMTTIHLKTFTTTLCALVRSLFHNTNIQFQIWVAPNVPMSFQSDERWLQQILINIVNNAIKHSQTTLIRLRWGYHAPHQQLRLSVIDFGQGMSKEAQDQIFNPYVQAKAKQLTGTGLGLTICQKLTTRLGGRIRLNSRLGQGSRFLVTLPLTFKSEPLFFQDYMSPRLPTISTLKYKIPERFFRYHGALPPPKSDQQLVPFGILDPFSLLTPPLDDIPTKVPPQRDPQLATIKFLVAEDFDMNIKLMKKIAQKHQLDFTFAKNGVEVLQQLSEQKFDVVLMDIQMPEMDGLEATRNIRKQDQLQTLPIIGLSAHIEKNIEKSCLEAGMNELMSKPFKIDKLTERVLFWLDEPT